MINFDGRETLVREYDKTNNALLSALRSKNQTFHIWHWTIKINCLSWIEYDSFGNTIFMPIFTYYSAAYTCITALLLGENHTKMSVHVLLL